MLVNHSLQMHRVNTLLHHHHSMEHSPLEAKRSSGNRETSHIHNSLPPVSILRYINSVHATPSHYLKVKFNIILPSTPRSPHQNPVCISSAPHTRQIPSTTHSSWFDNLYNIWWGVQIIQLHNYIVFFSPLILHPHFILNGLIIFHSITTIPEDGHFWKTYLFGFTITLCWWTW